MNKIIIVVWIALGIFLAAYSYSLGLGSLSAAGPGLMPFLVGVFLLLSGLALGYGTIKKSRMDQHTSSTDEPAEVSLKKSIILIVSLILYALVLEELGFIIATFLLMAISFNALGVKRLRAIGGSLVTVLICYFVFTYLGQRFPPGILRYIGMY